MENAKHLNKTDIFHVFTSGRDEYFTPAKGGEKAARKCFNKFKKWYGCARMYYRAQGEDEENDGDCVESFGSFPY